MEIIKELKYSKSSVNMNMLLEPMIVPMRQEVERKLTIKFAEPFDNDAENEAYKTISSIEENDDDVKKTLKKQPKSILKKSPMKMMALRH